jgi:hypothetical protein
MSTRYHVIERGGTSDREVMVHGSYRSYERAEAGIEHLCEELWTDSLQIVESRDLVYGGSGSDGQDWLKPGR